ncbi:hypothetical protein [Aestuariispira insulae]|uniref:Uncharacterized protein n=1 Tax=Aestuariispira insulae TaxID=1461337 RepID=A0A3D9HS22_9PROT|nr:hypothetical protein [Aestuariispira insulae]RED52131.1 hypothetical protein DFP90_102149 [Aestuariispira insulae]
MLHCQDIADRKNRLKQGLMAFACAREPDLDHDELESYLSDGVDEAFGPNITCENERLEQAGRAESRWQRQEQALLRSSQAP